MVTIPISKKGEKANPKNYRGIRLLSSILKLPTKIFFKEDIPTGMFKEQ